MMKSQFARFVRPGQLYRRDDGHLYQVRCVAWRDNGKPGKHRDFDGMIIATDMRSGNWCFDRDYFVDHFSLVRMERLEKKLSDTSESQ